MKRPLTKETRMNGRTKQRTPDKRTKARKTMFPAARRTPCLILMLVKIVWIMLIIDNGTPAKPYNQGFFLSKLWNLV